MRNYRHKFGLTLVEILIVVAIIAILVAMTIGIAARINIQSDKQLTKSTFAMLDAALEQFRDYGYDYKDPCFAGLKFPLDCNDFPENDLKTILEDALGLSSGDVTISGGTHDANYSGSEAMYFFLNRVPESRKILERINSKLLTKLGLDGDSMNINVDGQEYPLLRVIDPWGKTLRYSYYENDTETSNEPDMDSPRAFPVITSAGPDKKFGSVDDIVSR